MLAQEAFHALIQRSSPPCSSTAALCPEPGAPVLPVDLPSHASLACESGQEPSPQSEVCADSLASSVDAADRQCSRVATTSATLAHQSASASSQRSTRIAARCEP